MPATDALTAKSIFREDLQTPYMHRFLKGFLEGKSQRVGKYSEVDGSKIAKSLTRWIDVGETYYVHPRMSAVVTAAAESMPNEELLPQDLPTQQGFVLIPGGIITIDIRGLPCVTNAVLWTSFGGAVTVYLLSDRMDPRDVLCNVKGAESTPRWTPWHVSKMDFGKPLPRAYGPDMVFPPDMGISVDYVKQPDGTTNLVMASSKGYSDSDLHEIMTSYGTRPDPVLTWLMAMWRLMQQPLTSLEKEFPSRQQRRALERKNVPSKHVTVINLRRKTEAGSGDSEIHWTHRWLVRGHWRNQKYKVDGEWITRAIWIHPHVKGPEDAPLLVRNHVYSLNR